MGREKLKDREDREEKPSSKPRLSNFKKHDFDAFWCQQNADQA